MNSNSKSSLEQCELGKKSAYIADYNPDLLFPIPRLAKRCEIGISNALPFIGFDLWNHYEVSCLNQQGKPIVAIAEIIYPCESPNIIESKSMKLYFNSFNNTRFDNIERLTATIIQDLSSRVGLPVQVNITDLMNAKSEHYHAQMDGLCLDGLDITCEDYQVSSAFLFTEALVVEETLVSNLLKSNCLVTNQPDWGSIQIQYQGHQINHEGLLKYLVSFRNHNEFHEQCIERIFIDILNHCKPNQLSVYGRYTRRGGLDINPYRSTKNKPLITSNVRLIRQ